MGIISNWLTKHSNVGIVWQDPDISYLAYQCLGHGIGGFEVWVFEFRDENVAPPICYKTGYYEIAHYIRGDERFEMPRILNNEYGIAGETVSHGYHMVRCYREMERVGSGDLHYAGYKNGFEFYRTLYLKDHGIQR